VQFYKSASYCAQGSPAVEGIFSCFIHELINSAQIALPSTLNGAIAQHTSPLYPLLTQILHPWIFFWESSYDDDDNPLFLPFSHSPFLFFKTPSVSCALCKSVCDTISTPEIIVLVTNAAGRVWRDTEGKR